MLKRSLFNLTKPTLRYQLLDPKIRAAEPVPLSPHLTLLIEAKAQSQASLVLKKGDPVVAGQKLAPVKDSDAYGIAPAGGTIGAVEHQSGDFGKQYISITISLDADPEAGDDSDGAFGEICPSPTLAQAADLLATLPGKPDFGPLLDETCKIDTLLICGGHADLMVESNHFIMQRRLDEFKRGVAVFKEMTGIDNIIAAVPQDLVHGYGHLGVSFVSIDNTYPAAHPRLIINQVLKRPLGPGQKPESIGICVWNAEAVANLGQAFETQKIPNQKLITLIGKDGSSRLVAATVGTPVTDVLAHFNLTVADQDRIIFGGPLTGRTVYSDAYPVQPDTDAILIQDRHQIAMVSDYPCVNCGECVRACPAQIPVNMLVRFLEAGQYQTAADEYDLYSCIECGLCSTVCISKMPIFQYIMLAKFELAQMETAEASNA